MTPEEEAVAREAANRPLHNKWVLWYDNPKAAVPNSDWIDNLKMCGEFDTPAKFWQVFNNVKPSSQLSLQCNYHIFKEGIEPMWEDPQNKDGGKWVFTIQKKDPRTNRVDEWWLLTCLALIGEATDSNGDMVCGAVVSIRKHQDRIALWLKTDDPDVVSKIGARWKKALDVPNKIKYQVHRDGKCFVDGISYFL